MDEFGMMMAVVEETGRTWDQYVAESCEMDQEGAWNDPHFGPFQWQYHVPEPARVLWSDLLEQTRVAYYWAAQKQAQAASDAYGDALDRDVY